MANPYHLYLVHDPESNPVMDQTLRVLVQQTASPELSFQG